ncbi:PucR family transcriptional regulator [Kutzneria buriramensis]|uniref:PucR-like helix-turn-helix protein n=1 Tax=Kutzneria buriramensis TaxID=1045776 RepID=A0A3E0GTL1_9PSEU|nr:PucR family transcriptional regulator [Kutzneria buriramensis]REH26966.1 PucR-like helix-turn-helix protein [Kutzneria buriramensis]
MVAYISAVVSDLGARAVLPAAAENEPVDRDDLPRQVVMRCVLPLLAPAQPIGRCPEIESVRQVGRSWAEAGRDVDVLLAEVRQLTSDLVDQALARSGVDAAQRCADVRRVSRLGSQVLVEIAAGFQGGRAAAQRMSGPDGVAALLAVNSSDLVEPGPGLGYAVVAVGAVGERHGALERALLRWGGPATVSVLGPEGGHVVLAAVDEEDAAKRCACALRAVGTDIRLALVWSENRTLPSAKAVADEILATAVAQQFAGGVYRMRDVLIEFAASRAPEVSNALLRVIQPLVKQRVLWETLQVLLEEDGNRGRAAERLIIHRSTVDYRLQRIGQLTGYSPCSVRGLRVLAAATAMYRLAALRNRRAA